MGEEFEIDDMRSSRRDLLKKAGVGAAIVWTAPVVSSAITPAAAQTIEPECVETFVIKSDAPCSDQKEFVYTNDGSCSLTNSITPPSGEGTGDCEISTSFGSSPCSVTVTLPADATDIVGIVKQGSGCFEDGGTDQNGNGGTVSYNGNEVTFTQVGGGWSHVTVTFCSNACIDQLED